MRLKHPMPMEAFRAVGNKPALKCSGMLVPITPLGRTRCPNGCCEHFAASDPEGTLLFICHWKEVDDETQED